MGFKHLKENTRFAGMTPHKPSLRGPNQMANRRPFRVISCHDAIEFERRFTPNSGHAAGRLVSPLSANSGVVHHNKFELPMSAMGQFQPIPVDRAMSAMLPTATGTATYRAAAKCPKRKCYGRASSRVIRDRVMKEIHYGSHAGGSGKIAVRDKI